MSALRWKMAASSCVTASVWALGERSAACLGGKAGLGIVLNEGSDGSLFLLGKDMAVSTFRCGGCSCQVWAMTGQGNRLGCPKGPQARPPGNQSGFPTLLGLSPLFLSQPMGHPSSRAL